MPSRDEDKCHVPTKLVGRLVPEGINTEVLADARFDGREIAAPGVRARNPSPINVEAFGCAVA
jgi:hypothetical protein